MAGSQRSKRKKPAVTVEPVLEALGTEGRALAVRRLATILGVPVTDVEAGPPLQRDVPAAVEDEGDEAAA